MTHIRLLGPIAPPAAALAAASLIGAIRTPILPDRVQPNPNTERAGVLRGGVLTVALDARESLWRFSGGREPMTVAAFSELGKSPLMPGPLLRVPAGTQLRLTIHNSLDRPLTFIVPAALSGGPDRITAMDSVVVASGGTDTLSARATTPGNYVYRGSLPDGASKISHIAGALAGAIVVDSAGASAPSRDQVFVVLATEDAPSSACDDATTGRNPVTECKDRRFIYTINGTEWPANDRIHATVGDSLRWRVINASAQVHPMHLHGFYYRVDALDGPLVDPTSRPVPGQLVVTQLLSPLAGMSMSWSPDRPGNWLFHCHFALHNTPYAMIAVPSDPGMHDMAGLVLGVIVAPRRGVVAAGTAAPARRLRLLAEQAAATPGAHDTLPPTHFVLEEDGRRIDTHTDLSPELDLVRGQPVAITIVNRASEPTSVHWHGIEVEDSYMDGGAGFSGEGKHLAPAIAPGDSFVARFTPPRSGTFMYHAHFDEMREELAGLDGALIVRDPGAPTAPDDHVIFLKGDQGDRAHPMEINGQVNPDTIVLHVGHPARFRFLNLSSSNGTAAPFLSLTARPDSVATLVKDTLLVRWQPIAKDAFDLPASARGARIAEQVVAVGETFDVEFTPTARGVLRLEARASGPRRPLVVRVPIRVE